MDRLKKLKCLKVVILYVSIMTCQRNTFIKYRKQVCINLKLIQNITFFK